MKLTIEASVDAADYAAFKAEHDAVGRTVIPSFNARLNEVFGPDGGDLTSIYVHDVRSGQEASMDALRDRIRWELANVRFREEWLRETDPEEWKRLGRSERYFGKRDGLMFAWKELNRLIYGEANVND